MSTDFNLRALCYEVWENLGGCDGDVLARELLRRIGADGREAALSQAIQMFSRDFTDRRQPRQRVPLRERLERRTERVDDCFIWTGKTASNGYGAITIATSEGPKTRQVHRASYEEFVGPIPDGYEIDHTCHSSNPAACPGRPNCLHIRCWNPDHLEAVTHLENMRGRTSWAGRITHCKYGHEYTPENTHILPGRPNVRRCRACERERWQRRKEQQDRALLAATLAA